VEVELLSSLARAPEAREPGSAQPEIAAVCRGEGLQIAFQPIYRTDDASLYGYEALMRPPQPWANPIALIEAAHSRELGVQLELTCCDYAIRDFVRMNLRGKLFINLGAAAIEASGIADNSIVQCALASGLPPGRIVVELTEREPIQDMDRVVETMRGLRQCGLGVALDDYGQGYSGMRVWLELRPEILKIDQYFVRDLQTSSAKFEALRSIVRMAENLDTLLIAEGVETSQELAILRDLGVPLVQGYLLGRPAFVPPDTAPGNVREILSSRQIAVFPEKNHIHAPHQCAGKMLLPVPSVGSLTTVAEVARRFEQDVSVQSIAVVDSEKPVGLINRQNFLDQLNKPFHREVYAKRPCTVFMSEKPLIVEADAPIEALLQVLSGDDQRYLADGFIIVSNGRYLGMGRGVDLVRSVSALRIEAARHANPLTFLPGNIPISNHIDRLLASGTTFVAAYVDLDNFKPYNDQYGYWRGDEMIKLTAGTLLENVASGIDFVGHVGGDDFVLLIQSTKWLDACEAMVNEFRTAAINFYNPEDIARQGLHAEDRLGNPAFFPLATLSIGVVEVIPGAFRGAQDVASAAAAAKRLAKKRGGNRLVRLSEANPPVAAPVA
jgi:diguanylate cyclase (GGDEF)-like protein